MAVKHSQPGMYQGVRPSYLWGYICVVCTLSECPCVGGQDRDQAGGHSMFVTWKFSTSISGLNTRVNLSDLHLYPHILFRG